jgi:hypothetical protein
MKLMEQAICIKKDNQESFIQTCKPGVHIFTADGGFDFLN